MRMRERTSAPDTAEWATSMAEVAPMLVLVAQGLSDVEVPLSCGDSEQCRER